MKVQGRRKERGTQGGNEEGGRELKCREERRE